MSDPDERSLTSGDFPVLWPVTTRWTDNDMFGHLNNAVYYQLFDTAINAWVSEGTGLDVAALPVQAVVAESGCRYFTEVHFPQPLTVGVRVARLGRSSVTYRLGLFRGGDDPPAPVTAVGHWVHVYVDRRTRRPVEIPDPIRTLLAAHH